MNQLIVVEAILPGSGADADDPKLAEVPLARFPVPIGIDKRLVNGFFGELIELALIEVVTLRKLENFFSAVVAFCSTFNSRHGELLALIFDGFALSGSHSLRSS
jgi:hypothetical protein